MLEDFDAVRQVAQAKILNFEFLINNLISPGLNSPQLAIKVS